MQARSSSSSRRFSRNDSQRRRALSLELLEIRNLFSSTPLYYMVDGQRIELKPSPHEYAVQVSGDGKATVGSLNGAFGGLSGFSTEEKLKENVWRVSKLAGDAWSSQDVITSDSADLPSGVDWIAPTYTVVSSGATVAVLDEAVVALNSGVRPEDVFVKQEIVSFRPLLGTPDQFVVTLPKGGNTTLEYAIAIAENPQVAWATPNFYRNMTRSYIPNDTLFPNQWHLNNTGSQIADAIAGADIKAVGAWNLSTGTGVTIAILDDGIERTHSDLAANIFVNPGEIPGDGIDNDGNGYTDDVSGWSFATNSPNPSVGSNDEHGTSVAGVAAGVGNNNLGVAGSAFNAKILPVQMFNGSSYVGDANTASAIYYAAGRTADGLGTWNAAQVINASWSGGAPNSALNAAFTWANNVARGGKGVASFIASGNDYSSSVGYPANLSSTLSGVMAVGASNQRDQRSEYSNYGSALDLVAPSSDIDAPVTGGITTTDRTRSLGYNTGDYTNNTAANGFGGTSSASPLAAGVGALLLSADPNLTAAQVKQTLRSTADKVGGVVYDSNGFNSQYGYGRINAFAALQTLGMRVIASTPANSTTVFSPPALVGGYSADFNFAYEPDASEIDLTKVAVNGVSPTGVTAIDSDTLQFNFASNPISGEGLQTFTIDAGAVKRQSNGELNAAYTGTFRYDNLALAVTGTSPTAGSVITMPFNTLDLNFNEPILASSVQPADFAVNLGNVVGASLLDADTVRLTLGGLTSEGTLIVSLAPGALTDNFGNGNVAFSGSYILDNGTVAFPVPLAAKAPLASLVYDRSVEGIIGFAGDVDSFTLNIDPNQTISVIVTPITAGLQPRVELFSPANASLGFASAGAPGQVTGIQTIGTTGGGIYRIEVSGLSGSQGLYSVQVILNGAFENEGKIVGSTNNTAATAQNINGSFINLDTTLANVQRGAVLGTTNGAPMAEVEPNNSRVSAQNLESATWSLALNAFITNSTTVPHVSINGTGDGTFDYYSFQVTTAGSVGYFDIDFANFDTMLFLFDSTGALLASNDDSGNDTGSSSSLDSFISYTFATTGTYVIAVGEFVSSASGGVVSGNPPDSGDAYTLHFSVANHVSPSATMDFYRFDVAAGQRVSLALTNLTTGNVDVQLIGQNGATVLASGVGGAANLNEAIQSFLIGSAGTYFARVSGNAGVEYSLVVTKDAVFDTEANNTLLTAQDVTGSQGAIGHLQMQGLTAYDFENGQQGWTINNNMIGAGTAAGLWNLTTRRATDANHSPVTSFWYGNPATGNYDTGSRNAGAIVSPSFVVQSDTEISFKYFLDTEGGVTFDKATVQVSTNGGVSWTTVLNPLLESSVFTSASASLASYAGQTAQVRFVFDTIDSNLNTFEGWYVDDITINAAPDDDWYKVTLAADQTVVEVETRTPADGTGQFINTLNPRIQFFNSAGTDITPTVTILPDGRNEKFTATGLIPGQTYYVKVTAQSGPLGEYFVGIKPLRTTAITSTKDDGDWGFQLNGPGWSVQTGTGYQNDYRLHPVSAPSSATNVARWVMTPPGPTAEVFVAWVARPTNATNATYKIYDGATLRGTIVVDQTRSPNDALLYGATNAKSLGTFAFATKQMRLELLTLGANGDLVADGVFSWPVSSVPTTTSQAVSAAASRTTGQPTNEPSQTTLKTEIASTIQQAVQMPNTAFPTQLSARDSLFALMATRPLPQTRGGRTVGSSEWIDDLLRDDSDPAKQGQLVTTKDANPKLRRGR